MSAHLSKDQAWINVTMEKQMEEPQISWQLFLLSCCSHVARGTSQNPPSKCRLPQCLAINNPIARPSLRSSQFSTNNSTANTKERRERKIIRRRSTRQEPAGAGGLPLQGRPKDNTICFWSSVLWNQSTTTLFYLQAVRFIFPRRASRPPLLINVFAGSHCTRLLK